MSQTELFLIRHAEVERKYHRIFGGRIDMNLSEHGHEQAEQLAHYLHRHKFDAIFASPMKRVQQTLVPLLVNGTPQPTVLADLREVDFGDWTGHRWDEIQPKFNFSAYDWLDALERGALPNGESAAALRARVEPCLRQILHGHSGQTVAVYCHGGILRMLLSILLKLPLRIFNAFEVDYASLTQVKVTTERAEVQLLNFAPWRHLPE